MIGETILHYKILDKLGEVGRTLRTPTRQLRGKL